MNKSGMKGGAIGVVTANGAVALQKATIENESQSYLQGMMEMEAMLTKDSSKTLRTMMIEAQRLFASHLAICEALAAHGRYKLTGGGMMLGPYEGPKERDIHFALANARTYSNEWDINVNSDYELTNDDGCPADAKQIIETALRELSEAKPCECSKCLVPCKKRQCARCGNAIYCSAACQKRDWKAHKPFCTAAEK